MKKQLLLMALMALGIMAFNYKPDQRIFSTSTIVWCGIDLSEAKCIGSEGFTEPYEIKGRYFAAWNNLVLSESSKYNIGKFYKKSRVINDLSVVTERNDLPKVEELVINGPYSFEEGQLEKIVKSYDLADHKEGVGVVYVVESLNKTATVATVHVVFFDLATKEILWTKKHYGAPRGFGFRNYWAGAFLKIMEASEKEYSRAMKMSAKG